MARCCGREWSWVDGTLSDNRVTMHNVSQVPKAVMINKHAHRNICDVVTEPNSIEAGCKLCCPGSEGMVHFMARCPVLKGIRESYIPDNDGGHRHVYRQK